MPYKKPNLNIRSFVPPLVFALICLVFTVVLAVFQIRGPQTDYVPGGENKRVVTISGVRGEIYDKNGVKLVANSTSHNVIYEYGAMPSTFAEINGELVTVLQKIKDAEMEDKLSDDYFPIEGIYPNVRFSSAVSDTSSNERYYLLKVLKRKNLPEDISATELAEYYVNRCGLSDETYTPKQVMELMRLWYEMDRIDFGQFQAYTIAENVTDELVAAINETNITGVTFTSFTERQYLYPGYASHILGQVGKITAESAEYYSELGYPMDAYVGRSGCELAFESILHGQDGTMVIEYDDNGSVVNTYYETEPISGNDVYLTIDITVQIAAEDALKKRIDEIDGAEAGALTAIDPNTGAVIAIASYPTYDLSRIGETEYYNSLSTNENRPLSNRALGGLYAPGSTYKIGVALAALEKGETNTLDTCECTGTYTGFDSGNPKCNGVHGSVNIYTAIQESCNIFFYTLGEKLGVKNITDYTARLGLGVPTGIELADPEGTVAGTVEGKNWTKFEDVTAAIGQSDHAYTPMQLSVYMSSIVNGGTRYTAHVFDSERSFHSKEVISDYTPTVADTVDFSPETYKTLIDSMALVVSENSEVNRYFKNLPVTAGGKTGTAEKDKQADNALFCGFAPLESPQIVVSCVIEEGQHGYYASDVVASVMKAYFQQP